MQVTELKAEGLAVELRITLAEDDIAQDISQRLAELAKTIKMPGFRPGKIPVNLVKQRYGQQVRAEVLEKAVGQTIETITKERDIKPAVQPQVEDVDMDSDAHAIAFTLKIEKLPKIETMDFSKLKLERLSVEVPQTEIDEALKNLAERYKDNEKDESKKKLEMGDIAVIDFDGEIDGEKKDGMKAEDFNLELGSNMLIPGFEEQLVGLKAGKSKDVIVTFPQDYGSAEIAGKEAKFAVTVKEIRVQKPAEINEEFAKRVGAESLEKLREQVTTNLSERYKAQANALMKRAILDELDAKHDFELPSSLVEGEFDRIWADIAHAREHGHLDEEDKDKSEDELKDVYRKITVRRVKLGLLLSQVANQNNLTVTDEEFRRAVRAEASRYPGQEKQVIEYIQKNPQVAYSMQAPILEDKAVTFISEMAKVKEKAASVDELKAALEAADKN